MGIARGVAKAAKAAKKQTRGLQGNRNSQGDFTPMEMESPNTKLKQEALDMDDAELEQLAAKLDEEVNLAEQAQDSGRVQMLSERLDIVNDVIESRLQSNAEFSLDENQVMY
jgi:hypothetical protein